MRLAMSPADIAGAVECFREAIDIARRDHARSLELRAASSLARLLAAEGQRDEAHHALTGIYRRFTEGFDTADLRDAKILLGELHSHWLIGRVPQAPELSRSAESREHPLGIEPWFLAGRPQAASRTPAPRRGAPELR